MHLSKNSLKILRKSEKPSVFSISIDGDCIEIVSEASELGGDLLVFADDVSIASDIAFDSDGWVIFTKNARDIQIVGKPPISCVDEIKNVFERIFRCKGFSRRDEQVKVAEFIYECFRDKENGIIEAPPGTGKSLAYLVPAVMYTKRENKRVVVSTSTINLQRQLTEKDIPFLKKFLDFNVEIALGRNNYICKRKAERLFHVGEAVLFEGDLYGDLKEFLLTTEEGTKGEFFSVERPYNDQLWSMIESSTITCTHKACPYYTKDCFFYKARRRLDKADIIVANHHIVFSDSIMENAEILPEFDVIIFDEAHNIEKNATNYYTLTANSFRITSLLDFLYKKRKSAEKGLLVDIVNEDFKAFLESKKQEIEGIFKKILSFVSKKNVLLTDKNVDEIGENVSLIVDVLSKILAEIKGIMKRVDEDVLLQLNSVYLALSEELSILREFEHIDFDKGFVFWIQKSSDSLHFNITPLHISESLREFVYDRVSSAIFVSATLSVNGSFDFFKEMIGVDKAREFIATTYFDYEKNCRLFIVEDMNMSIDSYKFIEDVKDVLLSISEGLSGDKGVLVLFTSYKMLNDVFDISRHYLEKNGFRVMKQGELDNFELLSIFKQRKGFLFATSSFWEGIDVKGEKLSVLVIVRLPFEVPTTPIEMARFEKMDREGKNSFLEYSLPKAILRFKQGVGRLIRDENDRGVIFVLDSRVINKSYGKMFLSSVNYIIQERVKKNEIKETVANFFDSFSS